MNLDFDHPWTAALGAVGAIGVWALRAFSVVRAIARFEAEVKGQLSALRQELQEHKESTDRRFDRLEDRFDRHVDRKPPS